MGYDRTSGWGRFHGSDPGWDDGDPDVYDDDRPSIADVIEEADYEKAEREGKALDDLLDTLADSLDHLRTPADFSACAECPDPGLCMAERYCATPPV